MIAFIGSVFSPYYAWAIARGKAVAPPAANFSAVNVALYGKAHGWAMTERKAGQVRRTATSLRIGPSGLVWDGTALTAEIDEITVPVPRRLRGVIRLTPARLEDQVYSLDAAGRHRWRPIAPRARVELMFDRPGVGWQGDAYFDHNNGDVPLARDFSAWHWSRGVGPAGTQVLYDVRRRDGSDHGLSLNFSDHGVADFAPPPVAPLPRNFWGVARSTRADVGFTPRVIETFETAPFYSRAKIATRMGGQAMVMIHESLDLRRFAAGWVRALLPFRMPRR